MPRYNLPAGERKSFIFDLETTGLIQKFEPDLRGDVGISEFALREQGKSGGYQRFTNLLQDPLTKFDAGDIDARTFGEVLQARSPTGTRWQSGFKNTGNVLHGVLERHVDATRAAIAGRGDTLAKESKLVSMMTRYLRQGHNIKGWNIDFDMTVMSRIAARSSPAVQQRWARALNMARNRGQIEDMATGAKKFMFLAAQESAMQGKGSGKEFFTLGQVDKRMVNLAKQGKLTVDEIDKLSYDKLMEHHKGFREFFGRRLKRKGAAGMSYERYEAWLRRKHSYLSKPEQFATGQKYPNIRMTKGWSADILLGTLAPQGIKGSTLEAKAIALGQRRGMAAHEALSDTVYEEILDDIFKVKSKTWAGTWKEIAPRLREYGIEDQEQFFHRYRSAIENKGKTQLKEHALEATRQVDNRWERILSNRTAASRAAAKDIAAGARSQPETLRQIYSKAGKELTNKWQTFRRARPGLAMAAQVLAGAAIVEQLLPDRGHQLKGVRDPSDAPYANIDGISFGATGHGVATSLTDFGSGRRMFNPQTTGFAELSAYRSSLSIKFPDMYGVDFKTLEKNHEIWTSARSGARRDIFGREDYETVKGGRSKVRGLNNDAWVGIMDLDDYRVKVDDADTINLQRKGVVGWFRKPVSVRLAGIDAPEVEHPGMMGRVAENQFAGKQATEYLEKLIEKQQSLRLVVDPRSRSYNRNVGVLVGDRGDNLNLQMVRSGAAAHLPWNKRSIVDDNVFAQAEAKAAAGGMGMWQSKGWQMHRAMGIIAGQRVTNTTLTSLQRITKSNSLMAWYGMVQNAHDDKSAWTPQEMQRMYQVGAAYRAEVTGAINQRTAEIGPLPGLRRPVNPWQIAGHGINPSGANLSDFGSGRDMVNKPQYLNLPKGNDAMSEALRKTGLLPKEFDWLTRKGPRRDIRKLYRASSILAGSPFEEQILRGTGWKDSPLGLTNIVGEILDRNRSYDDIVNAPGVTKGARDWFGQTVKHARRLQARGMCDANIIDLISHGRKQEAGPMLEFMLDGLSSFDVPGNKAIHRENQIIRMKQARPGRAISPEMQRRIWAGEIQREERRARQLMMSRAEHKAPRVKTARQMLAETVSDAMSEGPVLTPREKLGRFVQEAMADAPEFKRAPVGGPRGRDPRQVMPDMVVADKRMTAKRPDAAPVQRAIKEATEEAAETSRRAVETVVDGASSRSTKTLIQGRSGYGAAIGVGIAAAAGLAIGAWALLRNKNEEDAYTLSRGMGVSPGEFVAMKQHPPFYASSKAAQWAEHRAMGNPAQQAAQEPSKAMRLLQLAPWVLNPFREVAQSPVLEAWDHFHGAKAKSHEVRRVQRRIKQALRNQDFSPADIQRWFDQTKSSKGFAAKITKDVSHKTPTDKLTQTIDGIKKFGNSVVEVFSSKKSKLGKGFANKIKNWFSNLSTRMTARMHGLDAETYANLMKSHPYRVGKLDQLSKNKNIYSWSRQKETFKYVWKHLFREAGSFGAKASGFRQIFANLGKLEQMRMGIQEGILDLAPGTFRNQRNFIYRAGDKLNKYMNKSKFFTGKFANEARKIRKVADKLKAFGVSKAGRVLGKVPYVNMAFGIIDGVTMMDQYENSMKGFAIETAAGTAGSVVETAIMGNVVAVGKAGWWAGFAIGEAVFPAGGGIVGGIIGAVVGVVGTLAAGMIAGQVTRAGVRGAGKLALGARMKRTIDPAAYTGPQTIFPAQGFQTMRQNVPRTFTKFHGLDPARPDLTPFGGPYNPIQGQDIDTRTLQIANNRRRSTAKPRTPRPISMFTPTFGLVNNVLWKRRRGSKVRSVVERGAVQQRLPRRSSTSRMLSHAA